MKTNLLCFFVATLFSLSSYAKHNKSSNNLTKKNALLYADLPNFSYELNNGPSDNESFTINDGLFLTRPYTVTAPAGYEVYVTGSPGFADQIVISGAFISLGPVPVYVRLKAGLDTGTYNGNVSITAPAKTILSVTHPAISYTISVTGAVTRKETIWNSGSWSNGLPETETIAIINDDYTTETNGNLISYNIEIASGKTVIVSNNSYIQVKNDATIDGTLIVESTGSFVQVNNLGTFTVNPGGISKVNKLTTNLNHWYDYTYWSSPVSNTTVNSAFASSNTNMRFWFNAANFLDVLAEVGNTGTYIAGHDDIDDNGNDWALLNGNTILQPGVGYAATHSGSGFTVGNKYPYIFTGTFNTGTITTPIFYNGDNGDLDWNFIGNPYPSAINVDSFFAANTGVIASAIYLWSHATPPSSGSSGNQVYNFNTNDYAIINGAGEVAGGSGLIPSRNIPSGQGFFIQGLTNGNATFTNAMRVAENDANAQFFKNVTTTDANKIWLNLSSNNGVFNQALIAYMDGATNGDDGSYYDALRNMSGECASMLYTTIAGVPNKKYAIQAKNATALNSNEIIPLEFYNSDALTSQFTIALDKEEGDFLENNPIYLKDNHLNMLHDLRISSYNFTASTGEFSDRFEVVFTDETLAINTNDLANQLSIIELNPSEIQFKTNLENPIESIHLYNTAGQLVQQVKANKASALKINSSTIATGTYIAKVYLENDILLTKKLVKQL
ncbi:T9SS type A sorting domain-containing protein [Oceanihabitans sp. 2_MG-2023]|uniref:T9SS type A sorting domain-containing protein n=1 Tax=Oceanihabitans sp. 2_MG-2023 TaxID=3062661 RepID=UPI0026E16BC1|nr:T9SS type A sorting domain-containing protein [Oceanihabitans sp. 2_MG-2023]MDO6595682.1 T9SS type A sorting domain-containing protein [Oceanihabitans sp. 2_MG-2023]